AAREMIDLEAEILNIDHHHTIEPFGSVNWIFPEASATCEILFYLFKGLNIPITTNEANALFTGILTDTGRFRFSNTSSEALRICAELVEYGVNPGWVTENIYYNFPAEQMKALGVALQHLEFYSGGKIALMEIPWAFATDDTEGFVEYATSIEGVMLGALITQMGPGEWKVSLRSRVSLDVSKVAKFFGGGGHKKAAGFKYKGELERLKEELVSVLEKGLINMEIEGSTAWISFHPEDEGD
ncbi:MAG: DHH family phosphoesterase, partial [bacterium]